MLHESLKPQYELMPEMPIIPNASTYLATDRSYPERFIVPDAFASWEVEYPEYQPIYFTHQNVLRAVDTWAEPEVASLEELAKKPLNPMGRTGIAGRGLCGKWGNNRAADAIVTRYSQNGNLELLTIVREDSGSVALPGGFIDAHELDMPVNAAVREAAEETGILLSAESARLVAKDYVITSARATDHAWITSTAFYWHLEGEAAEQAVQGLDDAADALWLTIDQRLMRTILQSHGRLVERALTIS